MLIHPVQPTATRYPSLPGVRHPGYWYGRGRADARAPSKNMLN